MRTSPGSVEELLMAHNQLPDVGEVIHAVPLLNKDFLRVPAEPLSCSLWFEQKIGPQKHHTSWDEAMCCLAKKGHCRQEVRLQRICLKSMPPGAMSCSRYNIVTAVTPLFIYSNTTIICKTLAHLQWLLNPVLPDFNLALRVTAITVALSRSDVVGSLVLHQLATQQDVYLHPTPKTVQLNNSTTKQVSLERPLKDDKLYQIPAPSCLLHHSES